MRLPSSHDGPDESSRGWSRTSGLRDQSPAFVPTQTTRELPRQESNLESSGSEPAAFPVTPQGNTTKSVEPLGVEPRSRLCKSRVLPVGRRSQKKSEPDAGFEPATQPWRGRVMDPLHQSGNKKNPKPSRVSGPCVLKKGYARLTRSGCPAAAAAVAVVRPAHPDRPRYPRRRRLERIVRLRRTWPHPHNDRHRKI